MRKITCFIFAAALIIFVAACGSFPTGRNPSSVCKSTYAGDHDFYYDDEYCKEL